jgi:hypothetical protein
MRQVLQMAENPPLRNEFDGIATSGIVPGLLLHCCCAPCASHVLEHLSPLFVISALFYNPNIMPREEYEKRAQELEKLLAIKEYRGRADLIACKYDDTPFKAAAAPFWDEPEGGLRCRVCFGLRLEETAKRAKAGGFDYFSTTLSVSPHKNAAILNEIGSVLEEKHGVKFLQSDFKKRDGYKRSVELSKLYGLYRQDYCGCTRS